jgi:hypothetical protein
MLWDCGYWELEGKKSPEQTLANGDIKFMKARTFVAA